MMTRTQLEHNHLLHIHEIMKSNNSESIAFMHKWLGTPFRMNGNSIYGVDCFNLCVESIKYKYHINYLIDNIDFTTLFENHPYEPTCSIHYIRKLREFSENFKFLDHSEILPFDIAIFPTTSHCGVMLTNRIMIHALMRNKSVILSNLVFSPWDSLKKIFVRYTKNG